MDETTNPGRDFLSTQKWLQLGRLAQRFATLLYSLLVLQAVARNRSFRWDYGQAPWQGASTSSKKIKWTTLMIIDSQAVKNTCNASTTSKGFCHYKATNGIKRHLAVDTLGFPFFTHCTKANISDDQGLIEMLSDNIAYFKCKPVNVPKITILVDHGYHPESIQKALEKVYPQVMTKNSLWAFSKAFQGWEGGAGQVWLCSSGNSMGRWALECLGGTVQKFSKELWVDFRQCEGKAQPLLYQANVEAISYTLKRYQMDSIKLSRFSRACSSIVLMGSMFTSRM